MRNYALLVAGVVAVLAIAGCSDESLSTGASPEQSSESGTSAPPSGPSFADPGEASGTPAPIVEAQAPGAPLIVAGAELAAPEGWQVTGVSSDDTSEVVSAVSDDGQFISLRSVQTQATVEQQIAEGLEVDSEQTVHAPEVPVDGEVLRGTETALTTSGGNAVQLRYFARRSTALITIDIVTSAEGKSALLAHLASGLTWR